MDEGYIYYTRTYKKLFLIIANVIPLIRIVLYFFNKVTQHIKMSFVKRKLAGLIFENKEKTKNSLIKLTRLNNNNFTTNKKIIIKSKVKKKNQNINNHMIDNNYLKEINNNDINSDFKNNIFKHKKEILLNDNSINKSNLSLNSDNAIKILNNKEMNITNFRNKSFSMGEPIKKKISPRENKIIINTNRKKYLFS